MAVLRWASDGSPSILRGSAHPLVDLRSWLILIITVKQHQFLGFWRIAAQSNTETRGEIACCPSDRQDNMIQQLAASTSTTSGAGALLTGTPIHLTSADLFNSFSQTPELVDERRGYMTQLVLEDICHLHATLLTDDQQLGE